MKTGMSTLLMDGKRFKTFLLMSILLHLMILASPFPCKKPPAPKAKRFNVKLIKKKMAPHQTKSNESKSFVQKNPAPGTKKRGFSKKIKRPVMKTQREATISLNAGDVKYTSYLSHLKSRIDQAWIYPEPAGNHKIAGEVTLCFSLDTRGKLVGINIISPSGNTDLDQASINAIEKAVPFDPLPAELKLTRLNVISSFIYQFSADLE